MKAIKVSDIAQIVDGQLHGDGEGIVTSVVIDSRKVQNDSMFAAFPGEKVDGHDYIGKAFESGASCCIGNFVPEGETRPMIIVEDVQKALKVLATWYRNTLTIPVIGITGSVGKTTTKEMVSSVLESRFKVLKTEANLNNELGVPLTIFRIEPEHDVAVIEMGISHFQEMTRLAQMAQPDIGIFTVIGYAHLENLGSREGILWAKTEMVKYMQPDGVMIVNGDDDLLYKYPAERDKVTYGTELRCKVRAFGIEMTEDYTACTISNGERTLPVRVHAYGNHIIYAALAAVTVGFQFGLSDEDGEAGGVLASASSACGVASANCSTMGEVGSVNCSTTGEVGSLFSLASTVCTVSLFFPRFTVLPNAMFFSVAMLSPCLLLGTSSQASSFLSASSAGFAFSVSCVAFSFPGRGEVTAVRGGSVVLGWCRVNHPTSRRMVAAAAQAQYLREEGRAAVSGARPICSLMPSHSPEGGALR